MYEGNKERLEQVLKHFDIQYSQITKNAVNISCPFCADEKQHLGIFLSNYRYSCFHCKSSGNLFNLLSSLVGISWGEYKDLMGGAAVPENETALQQIRGILNKKEEKDEQKVVVWPPEGSIDIKKMKGDDLVKKFLTERRFDFQRCIDNNVRIGVAGRYTGRFIVPVYFLGEIVAFQARDMTGKSDTRYLTEGLVSNLLYNADNIDPQQSVGIAEGIFSSWAIDNCVASFSASLSTEQINLMRAIDAKSWILCWDIGEDGSDAFWKSRDALQQLAAVFGSEKIKYVMLPHGEDPDSLGREKMRELLKCPRSI